MWLPLIVLAWMSYLVKSSDPGTVRGDRGPFRLKFLPVAGDFMDESDYPSTEVMESLDGIKIYLSKALEVDQLTSGISAESCDGIEIPLTSDSDFVIIIKNSFGHFELDAYTCYNQHDGKRNALAGIIYLYEGFNTLTKSVQYTFLLKRTLKILGFSESQLVFWRDSSGAPYEEVITYKEIRGQSRRYISTPKVVEKTFEAFQYNAGGMELDDTLSYSPGGSDTLNWESRILPYEVLSIPNVLEIFNVLLNPYISTITLAMLEDSGWYYPNYDMAQIPIIKRNAGQSWFDEACSGESHNKYPDPFAIPIYDNFEQIPSCSPTGQSLSRVYAYWSLYNYADDCVIPFDQASCLENPIPEFEFFLSPFNVYKENSRCFIYEGGALCLEVISCAGGVITFKAGSNTYICENEGDEIIADLGDGNSYLIFCPPYGHSCKEASCVGMCSGKGYCRNSKCICFDGYSGPDCSQSCPHPCQECLPELTGCKSCLPGFYFDNNNCLQCDSSCKTCSESAAHCTSCENGKYLHSNQCLMCDSKCSMCSSLTECSGCVVGYNLRDKNCCPLNCKKCTGTHCTNCDTHYFLESGMCMHCIPGCHLCEEGECSSCEEGFYKNGRKCSQCDISCSSCLGTPNCITCKSGYFNSGNGICINCPNTCSECLNGVCKTCIENYYVVGDICCPVGCKTCDLNKCNTCLETGYLYEDGKCILCPDACDTCLDGKCIGCQEGFYSDDKICKPCISGCAKCSNDVTCSVCLPGYLINSANTCDKRTQCSITGCDWCSDSVCFQCDCGYYLSSGICSPCAKGCLFCTGLWECLLCSDNYRKVGGSCCDSTRCSTCSPYGCTKCKGAYLLVNGHCENCPEYYENRGTNVCERCNYGFYFDGTSCISCPSTCSRCKFENNKVICTTCKSTFYLDGTSCTSCPSTCSQCKLENDKVICTRCKYGFYLDGTSCTSCPSTCSQCKLENNKVICTTCKYGFYLDGTSCTSCPSTCLQCKFENDKVICTRCITKHTLIDGNCIKNI